MRLQVLSKNHTTLKYPERYSVTSRAPMFVFRCILEKESAPWYLCQWGPPQEEKLKCSGAQRCKCRGESPWPRQEDVKALVTQNTRFLAHKAKEGGFLGSAEEAE